MAKHLDEAVCRGGPLELELVDRCPEACRAHSVELALCHDKPPAHIAVVEAEVAPA